MGRTSRFDQIYVSDLDADNIGVGTTNPEAALHITGNAYVSSNLQVGEVANLYVDTENSRIGIGKTNPGFTLDVNGIVNATSLYVGGSQFIGGGGSAWTESGSDIYYTDGSVGVGTTNPDATLHITGNTYVSSNLQVGQVANLYVDTINSRVGIGKTDPEFTFDVNGDINFSGSLYEDGSPFVSSPWTIETVPDALSYTDGSIGVGAANPEATLHITGNTYVSSNLQVGQVANLYVDTINSRVGINKSDPSVALDVNGATTISGVTDVTDSTVAKSTTTGALKVDGGISTQDNVYVGRNVFITSNLNVDTSTLHVDSVSSRVGIGKTDPSVPLDVSGATTISGVTTLNDSTASSSKDTGALILTGGGLGVEANIHSTNVFAVSHVGIGTNVADASLHITGNVYASSNLQIGQVANLYVDTINSRVGINKSDPSVALDVSGATTISGVTTLNDSTASSSKDTGALILTEGGLGVEANIHSTNVFAVSHIGIGTNVADTALHVIGGVITNDDQVAYKRYSHTFSIGSSLEKDIQLMFGAGAFYAKIVAMLRRTDGSTTKDLSTMVLEVQGGSGAEGTPSDIDIAIGTQNIFGGTNSYPWSPTVTVGTRGISIVPHDIDTSRVYSYDISVKLMTSCNGKLEKITRDLSAEADLDDGTGGQTEITTFSY